jgi:tight adherence protein B
MSSSSPMAAVVVSVAAGLLVGFAVLMLTNRRLSTTKRIGAYVSPVTNAGDPGRSLIERALGDRQARTITRSPLITRLRTEMEVADLKFGPEQLMVLIVVVTALVGWLLVTSTHSPIAGLLALFVPFVAQAGVKMMADRQRRQFAEQLPDNLQVIASAMRAGQTFVGALRAVLEDAPEPSQRELRRAVTDEQLGIPLADALGQVTERMKSEDFQHIAIVASLQRETGGNTAEVVDLVAETVQERIEIRRMVRGLTAQGRLSGGVLSLLPVGLLMLISLINPTYVHPMFHTTTGLIGLGIGVGLVIVGGLVIRKIVDIKV